MVRSSEHFLEGLTLFSGLQTWDKRWVTSAIIQHLSLSGMKALDELIDSLQAARLALREGVSVSLSHNSQDKRFARSLKGYLEKHGIDVWMDEADLYAGQPLLERLAGAVNSSKFLVAVLSQHSVQSPWVKKELALAADEEVRSGNVKVVPIVINQCAVPLFLSDKLYLDFRTPASRRKNRPVLVDSLMQLARTIQTTRRRLGNELSSMSEETLRTLYRVLRDRLEGEASTARTPRATTKTQAKKKSSKKQAVKKTAKKKPAKRGNTSR